MKAGTQLTQWSTIVLLFLLLFPYAVETAPVQDAVITYTHKERSLKPGEVILIKARSPRPLKSLRVEAFDLKFSAFGEKGGLMWTGLVGIDLETKPGRYGVVLRGTDMDGKNVIAKKSISVAARNFPTRRLEVDGKFVTPPADELTRIAAERERVAAIFSSVTPENFWHVPFRLPVPGKVISAFGKRNVYNGQPRDPHTGTDFAGAVGTLIRAPNGGRVVLAANLYYSGNTVILDHGLGLYSYLGHMSVIAVKEGDKVDKGDIVGKVGATGRVTGPHLHWTVRLATARVDPLSLVSVLSRSN